jgi:hypothetical protein
MKSTINSYYSEEQIHILNTSRSQNFILQENIVSVLVFERNTVSQIYVTLHIFYKLGVNMQLFLGVRYYTSNIQENHKIKLQGVWKVSHISRE